MRIGDLDNDSKHSKPANDRLSFSFDDQEHAWVDDTSSEDLTDWLPPVGMAVGGLGIVCAICALSWWIYTATLTSQVRHQLVGANIEHLLTGAPVEMAGVEVGTVEGTETERGNLVATLRLQRQIAEKLPSDSGFRVARTRSNRQGVIIEPGKLVGTRLPTRIESTDEQSLLERGVLGIELPTFTVLFSEKTHAAGQHSPQIVNLRLIVIVVVVVVIVLLLVTFRLARSLLKVLLLVMVVSAVVIGSAYVIAEYGGVSSQHIESWWERWSAPPSHRPANVTGSEFDGIGGTNGQSTSKKTSKKFLADSQIRAGLDLLLIWGAQPCGVHSPDFLILMGEAMMTTAVDDGSQVCEQAIVLAKQGDSVHWDLSEKLSQIKKHDHWKSVGAKNFTQFLQHARVAESTARQLMKVRRICDEHSIPRETMEACGWSKLAEVAKYITSANKDDLLADVSQLSLADLRAKYRHTASEARKASNKKSIEITDALEDALREAASHTGSDELQVNLDFIAQQFTKLVAQAAEGETECVERSLAAV